MLPHDVAGTGSRSHSGVDFRPGDEIGFGGGQSSLTPELRESFDIPKECGDGPVWFVAPGLLEN